MLLPLAGGLARLHVQHPDCLVCSWIQKSGGVSVVRVVRVVRPVSCVSCVACGLGERTRGAADDFAAIEHHATDPSAVNARLPEQLARAQVPAVDRLVGAPADQLRVVRLNREMTGNNNREPPRP